MFAGSQTFAGMGLRFNHFGLAVPQPGPAFRFLAALGYEPGRMVFDPLENVNLPMRQHGDMPDVEVIWPGEGASPIDRIIKRGHMIYHLCYVTSDADASIAALEAAGMEMAPLGPAKPALLFGGRPVSFHGIDQVGMIELIHGEPE